MDVARLKQYLDMVPDDTIIEADGLEAESVVYVPPAQGRYGPVGGRLAIVPFPVEGGLTIA